MSNKKRKKSRGSYSGKQIRHSSLAKTTEVLKKEAKSSVANSSKLVGVMPEQMAKEVEKTGVLPFTFKSACIIAGAILLGTILIPFVSSSYGVSIGVSTTAALPILAAVALAFTRYFVDSNRGFCRGLVVTFVLSFVALTVLCWLLFFQGVLI